MVIPGKEDNSRLLEVATNATKIWVKGISTMLEDRVISFGLSNRHIELLLTAVTAATIKENMAFLVAPLMMWPNDEVVSCVLSSLGDTMPNHDGSTDDHMRVGYLDNLEYRANKHPDSISPERAAKIKAAAVRLQAAATAFLVETELLGQLELKAHRPTTKT